MNRITSITVKVLLPILISTASLTARAQDGTAVSAGIPFAFSVDGQDLAAGTYQFQPIDNSFSLSIRNQGTGNELVIVVHPEEQQLVDAHGRLVFHFCEGHAYLSEVHIPGTVFYSEVVPSHGQKSDQAGHCTTSNWAPVDLR